jgi:hypothetical protein
MKIHGDPWSGVSTKEWEVPASPSALEFHLARLDAEVFTFLALEGAQPSGDIGKRYLGVGGGAGQYVVYHQMSDFEFWNLLRPDAGEGTVYLNTGGQVGGFRASQVVDFATARAACLWYLEHEGRNPELSWEEQG